MTYCGHGVRSTSRRVGGAGGAAAQTTWRNTATRSSTGSSPAAQTAIGDALRAGLNNIVSGGRASSQVMILFTDGLQNAGSETAEDVLPGPARQRRARLHGRARQRPGRGAARRTSRRRPARTYFPIDGDLSAAEAATAITEALVQIAGESRENGGIVSFNAIDGASPDGAAADKAAPFDWHFGEINQTDAGRNAPLLRVHGADHARAARMRRSARSGTSRSGVHRAGDRPRRQRGHRRSGRRRVSGKYPYGFWEIDNPKAGNWTVACTGAGIDGTRSARSASRSTTASRSTSRSCTPHVRLGDDIEVRARLRAPFAVPGAKITGWALTPSGKWVKLKFTEHTGAKGDPNEPFTYTARIQTKARCPAST